MEDPQHPIDRIQEKEYIDLPGLRREADRLRKLLEISSTFDHILIRGPRGSGKSYFRNVFEKATEQKPIIVNCAALHPDAVVSELFGHQKGSFTGADRARNGFIKTAAKEKRPLFLEELNSLDPAHQAKLLVFMERGEFYPLGADNPEHAKVRILAAMNDEGNFSPREDLLDRFKITVTVPPLYKRRGDIFAFIANEYPDLEMHKIELLSLFAYNWPGNIRELGRALYEMKAGLDMPQHIFDQGNQGQESVKRQLLRRGWDESTVIRFGDKIFKRLIPFDFDEISVCESSFAPLEKVRIERINLYSKCKNRIRCRHQENCNHCEKIEDFVVVSCSEPSSKPVPCDMITAYFSELRRLDNSLPTTVNSDLFSQIEIDQQEEVEGIHQLLLDPRTRSERHCDFAWKTPEERIVLRKKREEKSPISSKDYLFLRALRRSLVRHSLLAGEKNINHDEAFKEEVIDFLVNLGPEETVNRFILESFLKRFKTQKELADHWSISPSALNNRIKKLQKQNQIPEKFNIQNFSG